MYARRFYRQSPPPGYAGVAFFEKEAPVPEAPSEESNKEQSPQSQPVPTPPKSPTARPMRPPKPRPEKEESPFSPRALRPSAESGRQSAPPPPPEEREENAFVAAYRRRQQALLDSYDNVEAREKTSTAPSNAPQATALPAMISKPEEHEQTATFAEDKADRPSEVGADGFLKRLIRSRFSLEDLLLIAVALLLASGEADDEVLLLLGLMLVLMGK